MKWVLRTLLLGALCSLALATASDAKKPPFTRACQLATNTEVSVAMGRTVHRVTSQRTACGWRGGRHATAFLNVYAYKKLADAKDYLASTVRGYELCYLPPDHFLPGSGLGDDAWVENCGSNIAFRVGHVVGEVNTFSDDVDQGSPADTHRTAAIVRRMVAHLHRLRLCVPAFCL